MPGHPIRLLFNAPMPDLSGGMTFCENLLAKKLRMHLKITTFQYGRKKDAESIFEKCLGRSEDLLQLRSKIRYFRPDLIHHNSSFDTVAFIRDAPLLWLCKRYNIPTFFKLHGSFDESFGKMGLLLDRLRDIVLRNVHYIGVLSELEKQRFLERWPFLHGRIEVVKNCVHQTFYKTARAENQFPTILFVSRFIRKKGIFDLLQAIPTIVEKVPTAQFVFVGSGSDAAEFDRGLRLQAFSACSRRFDHMPNLALTKFYASAWMLLFPTHFPEGMPMVVAEAMAAGLPIITTRTKFSQSYMADKEHCLFIDYNSPASIDSAISYLVERPSLRYKMSQNNRQLAMLFQPEVVAREYNDLYQKILQNSPRQEAFRIDEQPLGALRH